ncbi:ubiquitin carboxyl-terminal hydrolase 37 isoform X2 [Microcaecilia unicolor]|nr:ubiquitin carboxyl-terminal hydrolase 37 isoform X2 [Microcaecilia unicolor]
MAPLKVHGPIRIHSLNTGTSKWKEGSFEIVEKDSKISLVVHYNAGGMPKIFQLNHNIKNVVLRPSGMKQSRLMLTLKDTSSLTIDKIPCSDADELSQYLHAVCQDRNQTGKPQGSGSFQGILGSRTLQKETNRQLSVIKNQAPSRKVIFENKDETPVRKPLGSADRTPVKTSPGNTASGTRGNVSPTSLSPLRMGLLENRYEKKKRIQSSCLEIGEDYPKENDSATNNKALTDPARKFLSSSREKQLSLKNAEENRTSGVLPLQSSSFYSSRSSSKDYAAGSSYLDRSNVSNQSPSAKRSLGYTSQPSPLSAKKIKPNQDYTGWSKPRVPLSSHMQQQQLQGFSNLGNTCYMNAILQSLFSLQPFANDLLKQGIPWRKIPFNALIRRFALLLARKDICSPESKKELLKKVKSAISATAERFSGYMQNDAHEFLSQCLDQLKEDMEKLNKSWKTEPVSGEENSPPQTCDITSTRVYTCPVVCNLEFEVQHSISCKMCGETVTKREQFNDLSIDLPRRKKLLPARSIQDSLDLFFRMEEIEYSCEKCNSKCAIVMHKFNRLPRVLILHLKRYSFNVVLSLNNKVGQQVIIPRYLTLSYHCMESTRPPLTLGWNTHAAIPRPLKASQMVNSCTVTTSTPSRKYTFKSKSICLDSDSDDEQFKRSVALSQKLCEALNRDQQQQEDLVKGAKKSKTESGKPSDASFNGMSEEEVIAAVLEMSKKEMHSESHEEEEKPTSSPDTGYGEEEMQEMLDNSESMEIEKPAAPSEQDPTNFIGMTKEFDENKENKTPEGSQGDMDWLQQYDLEREREEQELQQALAQSLREHEAQELKEDDDLKRATELSLQDFNCSLLDGTGSDEDSGNEDVLDMEYTVAEAEELKKNAETGDLPHSYRLVSVVSHIGSTSSSGHYISDVYDIKKQGWFTYNDLEVSRTQEMSVQNDRDRSGYIFFYMHK